MKSIAYEVVFNQIIECLENGVIPWKKSWSGFMPYNGKTDHRYNGINLIILSTAPYNDPRWFTYKQLSDLGGTVRKGEKSKQIVFWTILKKEEENKTIPLLKYFNVFNYEQIEGLKLEQENEIKITEAEDIISGFSGRPVIKQGYDNACYVPSLDEIRMPRKNQFDHANEYYATLFHELVHSVSHEKRLNRKLSTAFGSELYSENELEAEFGSAFLCNLAGIDNTIENSAAYIQSWLKALKNNPKMLVSAASKAQKSVDYILGQRESQATQDMTATA